MDEKELEKLDIELNGNEIKKAIQNLSKQNVLYYNATSPGQRKLDFNIICDRIHAELTSKRSDAHVQVQTNESA